MIHFTWIFGKADWERRGVSSLELCLADGPAVIVMMKLWLCSPALSCQKSAVAV